MSPNPYQTVWYVDGNCIIHWQLWELNECSTKQEDLLTKWNKYYELSLQMSWLAQRSDLSPVTTKRSPFHVSPPLPIYLIKPRKDYIQGLRLIVNCLFGAKNFCSVWRNISCSWGFAVLIIELLFQCFLPSLNMIGGFSKVHKFTNG